MYIALQAFDREIIRLIMEAEYQTYTDSELLTALNRGEAAAFQVIYKRYVSSLFAYARRNISSKEECEEILQEIFTWLWLHRETVKITSLRAYLFQAVKAGVIKYIRRQEVHRKYARHYVLFESIYDIYAEAKHDMEPKALQQWIDTTIEGLHDRCRDAFRLRYMENLSNAEIAQRMNINKRTADNYIVSALAHLRASYKKLYRATIVIIYFYCM